MIISLPVWGIWLSCKKINQKSVYGKWCAAFDEYDKFRHDITKTRYHLIHDESTTEKSWNDVYNRIKEKGIDVADIKPCDLQDLNTFDKILPARYIGSVCLTGDLPGKFACKYDSAMCDKYHWKHRAAIISAVVAINIIYAMFMLPFIFMWL